MVFTPNLYHISIFYIYSTNFLNKVLQKYIQNIKKNISNNLLLFLKKKNAILVHVDRRIVNKKYCHAEYKCVLLRVYRLKIWNIHTYI